MNKKLGKFLSVLVLMFPLLASFAATTAQAAEGDKVTVNLHKRVFENGDSQKDPYAKKNTGEEMADFGGTPLNGVTFEAYDVSAKYLELLATMSPEDATAEIVENAKGSHYAPDYAIKEQTQTTTGKENHKGIATFTNLDIKKDGKFATYLFVETNSPADIKEKAVPIVLTMPIYKGDTNEINNNVHIYPKNEKEKLFKKEIANKDELEVTINGKKIYATSVGELINYSISALVPWNIADKDVYRITDTPDEGMVVLKESVKIDGLTRGTDYIIYEDATKRGYVVYFNTESEAVRKLAGERISIKYNAKLTADVKIDAGIDNGAYVEIGSVVKPEDKPKFPTTPTDPEDPNYPEDPKVPTDPEKPTTPIDPNEPGTPENPDKGGKVFTGGKKFQKVDDKSGKSLAGAEFNLVKVNNTGEILEYATYENGKYTWNADKTNATSFASDAEGKFEVTGLEYSEKLPAGISYALKETKAPEGYALLEKPVTFDVVKDQFGTEILSVTNIKKGLLPSTGGNGIYMFLVAGAVLMAGALVWYRRTQVEAEI